MDLVRLCLFSCAFLQLCSALNINCTVTPGSQDSDQTTYSISDVSRVSDDQARVCEYSWSGKQVLANHKGSDPELVVRNDINDLTTTKCLDGIDFKRHCGLELEGFTAYCMTNCTLNALRKSEKPKESVDIAAIVVPVLVLVLVVVLVVLGVCAVLYKFWGRISSSKPVRWIYTAVKMKNVPNAADPEAGENVESRSSSDQSM